jgi:hypothetical protein
MTNTKAAALSMLCWALVYALAALGLASLLAGWLRATVGVVWGWA